MMKVQLSELSDEAFIAYLKQLEIDFRESDHPSTAADYKEMIRRLEEKK